MPLQNQVSFMLSPEDLAQTRAAVETLEKILMPKLTLLDSQLRQELPKMGNKTVGFVTKALDYAESNPVLLPRYFELKEAKIDLEAVSILREFDGTLGRVAQMVEDTMTLSGSEAYTAALSFYSAVKVAAKDHQPGAQLICDDLKANFPRNAAKSAPEQPSK